MKKQLCIVSHSHWDREWYLSHARHNFRLVRFFDRLLDVLKNDAEFRTFHLDGQIIILEDYLAVRPEREAKIKEYIASGRLKIGPFYVLQDEYLISGESNIRNLLVGLKECEKYGKPSMTGYFPDAFGNIGQMPQILSGFGLDNAFFGRGIIPAGYANEVLGKSDEGFSEIIWEGADGSSVIGVQFVNWYNNAAELETENDACVKRIERIFADSGVPAKTPYLLGMNGCDHQPVQADLSLALRRANQAGYDVVHVSLEEYMQKIRPYRKEFYRFKGEICGQNGSGYGTLINTASSRIYLKILNYRAQHLLETLAEPISVIAAANGVPADGDMLYYCWKKLLENHPHDSICGCGVDSVHDAMENRLSAVIDTTKCIIDEVGEKLVARICGTERQILVVNCSPKENRGVVECIVDYPEDERPPKNPCVTDADGNETYSSVERLGKVKTFVLPEDKFRKVFSVTRYKVKLYARLSGGECKTYSLTERKNNVAERMNENNCAENEYVVLSFNKNGTFNVTDKESGKKIFGQNCFAETGDCGNEYEFIRTGETFTTKEDVAEIKLVSSDETATEFSVKNKLRLQNGGYADIESCVTLERGARLVKVRTSFKNECKDHRIRARFPYAGKDFNGAAGQFDIVGRKNIPGKRWKNPENPQRAETFIERYGEDCGMVVAVRGLNEYEINRETGDTELTLVRGVGQMGDWFYFPTKSSQCLRLIETEYAVGVYGARREEFISDCYEYARPSMAAFVGKGKGETPRIPVVLDGKAIVSCLKPSCDGKGYVIRTFNPYEYDITVALNREAEVCDMREIGKGEVARKFVLAPKKILTLRFSDQTPDTEDII